MNERDLRQLAEEVSAASDKLGSKTRSIGRKLRAIKPTPIVGGIPLPQTISLPGTAGNSEES